TGLVVNGRIIASRVLESTTYPRAPGGGLSSARATAIGNLISVQVSGRNNTVVLNARQVNNGQLNARVDL
ncbi:MAG: hypothetical protein ACK5C7_01020, partial [Brevundimonas sp.]